MLVKTDLQAMKYCNSRVITASKHCCYMKQWVVERII